MRWIEIAVLHTSRVGFRRVGFRRVGFRRVVLRLLCCVRGRVEGKMERFGSDCSSGSAEAENREFTNKSLSQSARRDISKRHWDWLALLRG